MANAHPSTLLSGTLQSIGQSDVNAGTGAELIKEWISVLKHTPNAETATECLQNLYDELVNPQPNADNVKKLLRKLAQHTLHLSRSAAPQQAETLQQLAGALQSFSQDLGQAQLTEHETNNQSNQPQDLSNMAHHTQKIDTMIDDTLSTLGGGAPSTTMEHGVNLVEDWISIVRTFPQTQWLESPLANLRDALDGNDNREVERALREVAGATADLAENAEDPRYKQDLRNLANTLKDFAQGMAK